MPRLRDDKYLVARLQRVSMRARFAYAMCHLEASIIRSTSEPRTWLPILSDMWRFCSEADLDFWQERAAEYMPSVICSLGHYATSEFTYLTPRAFEHVRRVYAESSEGLSNMIEWIYDLGTLDMFGALSRDASGFEEMEKIVEAAGAWSVPSVDASRFSFSCFSERAGWGDVFDPARFRAVGGDSELEMFLHDHSVLYDRP